MVLPLIDEHKPRCYLCYKGFDNIETLKEHHFSVHKDFFKFHEKELKKGPTPGDVNVF